MDYLPGTYLSRPAVDEPRVGGPEETLWKLHTKAFACVDSSGVEVHSFHL